MAYTKTVWKDGGPPALSATNLNKLETQYDEAKADLDAHLADIASQDNFGHIKVDENTIIIENGVISVNPIIPFYQNGNEYEANTGGWVEGYSRGNGSAIKEIDYLQLTTDATSGAGTRVFVTNYEIEFSKIEKLFIEWEKIGTAQSQLIVSADKTTGNTNYVARFINNDTNHTRRVDELDVVALAGKYYIKTLCESSTGQQGTIKIYGVWGEK